MTWILPLGMQKKVRMFPEADWGVGVTWGLLHSKQSYTTRSDLAFMWREREEEGVMEGRREGDREGEKRKGREKKREGGREGGRGREM